MIRLPSLLLVKMMELRPSTMERRINAMKATGIDVEFHKYPDLGHGFGLGIGTSAEGWIDDAIEFWKKHITE